VMIAIAISCQPRLLIADEPTTALDVTIQAQILELLGQLRRELDMAVLLITHDFGVVAESCDRVAVMYAGRIMEEAPTGLLFAAPRHPYTVGLLGCIPRLDEQVRRLRAIPGQLPSPDHLPAGCRFSTRCPQVMDDCRAREPELVGVGLEHRSRCWLHQAREEAR
jgi:peptide/nickel transport system ATP-binding protein